MELLKQEAFQLDLRGTNGNHFSGIRYRCFKRMYPWGPKEKRSPPLLASRGRYSAIWKTALNNLICMMFGTKGKGLKRDEKRRWKKSYTAAREKDLNAGSSSVFACQSLCDWQALLLFIRHEDLRKTLLDLDLWHSLEVCLENFLIHGHLTSAPLHTHGQQYMRTLP